MAAVARGAAAAVACLRVAAAALLMLVSAVRCCNYVAERSLAASLSASARAQCANRFLRTRITATPSGTLSLGRSLFGLRF